MTLIHSPDAPCANLIFEEDFSIEVNDLKTSLQEALEAFGQPAGEAAELPGGGARLTAGPIRAEIAPATTEHGQSALDIRVSRLRDSEALHPEAATAILAEVTSLLVERFGGDAVHWGDAGVNLDAARFLSAFTPLRQRGGPARICPRRIRPGETRGTPIRLHSQAATPPSPEEDAPRAALKQVFAPEDPPQSAPHALSRLGAWAATATVGVMNPVIGLPLAAHHLVRGSDLRLSTQAFALTALLSGLPGSGMGYLSGF